MTLDSTSTLYVPAWTPVLNQTWTVQDMSGYQNIGGYIGLAPTGVNWQGSGSYPLTVGEITFRWWADPDATQPVGVKGFPLTSLIPSNAQLLLANQGPYLTVQFQAFKTDGSGAPAATAAGLAMRLFGTNRDATDSLLLGDAILMDEQDRVVPATVYPTGYYAGPMLAYLEAPAGVAATLYGFDLECKWWRIARLPGDPHWEAPFGAWFVYVTGTAGQKFTLSITPET